MSPATTSAEELKRRIDDELTSFLADERSSLEPEIRPLADELQALISSGGKRLRPRFCYWGYEAGGGTGKDRVLRLAASFELLHAFALINDDVMDRSALRRHRRSTFAALAEQARRDGGRGDPGRFGTSAALLTGILAFVLADRMLLSSAFEPDVMAAVTERFDRMRTRAIAGQYLDLAAARSGEADEETVVRIAALKTGSYTVTDPLVIGALAARAARAVVDVLEAYGRPLGQAFQIADDVLGTFGDPERTGKDRDGDLREGKQTLLVVRARAGASPEERAFLEEKVGDPSLDPADAERLRTIIVSSGALASTERTIAELARAAEDALDASVIGERPAAALRDLAAEATTRQA